MFRRPFPCRFTFDGQSRVNVPPWSGMIGEDTWVKWLGDEPFILGYGWPRLATLGMGLPAYTQPAVGGTSMTTLAGNFETRCAQWIAPASLEPTIYVLCGGHTDYQVEHNTGAQVYSDAGDLADLARAAGAVYVICTTTLPSIAITGTDETERQAGNALILADAGGQFDATIDFEVDGLDDPLDVGAYFDGVHIYGFITNPDKGTGKAAVVARPFLEAAVAEVLS